MLAKSYGSSVYGVDANVITIEVNVSIGARFHMVGLPDNAIKESEHFASMRLSNTVVIECPAKR